MSENETALATGAETSDAPIEMDSTTTTTNQVDGQSEASTEAAPEASTEEITYNAVEKDGEVTAIWEMQGRKHLRTIDPRSRQGQEILRLYTSEH